MNHVYELWLLKYEIWYCLVFVLAAWYSNGCGLHDDNYWNSFGK